MKRSGQLAVMASIWLSAGTAQAQSSPTCSYDGATAAVTVMVNGIPATLKRSGNQAILLNDVACEGATALNTDTITVLGGDLGDRVNLVGKLTPGATAEVEGLDEIEVAFQLGAGIDVLSVVYPATPDVILFGIDGIDVENDQDVDVTIAGIEMVGVVGGGGDDTIDARLYTGSSLLSLEGRGGNDRIYDRRGFEYAFGAGNNFLLGGPGDDYLEGNGGDDHLYGDDGNDELRGGNRHDFLYGGAGDDRCYGELGDDTFIAEATFDGNDFFYGGTGQDPPQVDTGVDTIDYSQRTKRVTVTLGNGLADDGEPGVETDFIDARIDDAIGGRGNDLLIGDASFNDLIGNAGNDVLYGGGSFDRLYGGSGNDRFVAEATVDGKDWFYGGDGSDTIDYSARTNGVTVTLGFGEDDGEPGENDFTDADIENATGGAGNDVLVGVFTIAYTLRGNAGDDDLYGSFGNDALYGGAGADLLVGDAGDDTLQGHGGHDALDGGLGDDTLDGGTGNDDLDGGSGMDLFSGGDGDDTFVNDDGVAETVDCGAGLGDDPEPSASDTFIACEMI